VLADAGLDDLEMDESVDTEFDYDQLGFIIEVEDDDFSWVSDDGDSSMTIEVDEPVYIVALAPTEAGAHPFQADALEVVDNDGVLGDLDVDARPSDAEESMDDSDGGDDDTSEGTATVDVVAPDQDTAALEQDRSVAGSVPRITRNQMGLQPWPESWRESDKPARLIALDAWTSMGSTFRGCRRSMSGHIRNPNNYCGAYKDAIYGHTYWRSGG